MQKWNIYVACIASNGEKYMEGIPYPNLLKEKKLQ